MEDSKEFKSRLAKVEGIREELGDNPDCVILTPEEINAERRKLRLERAGAFGRLLLKIMVFYSITTNYIEGYFNDTTRPIYIAIVYTSCAIILFQGIKESLHITLQFEELANMEDAYYDDEDEENDKTR